MQDPMAQLEEMTRATEQLISTLASSDDSERLEAVGQAFAAVLEKQRSLGPLDFSGDADPVVPEKARKAVQRLNDLTRVALAMAAQQQGTIAATLTKSREVRHFLDAAQASRSAPEGELDRSA